MPSRTHPDEKLLLLFHCLKASDYTTIDFHAVAATLGITVAAARMRLNRLKAEIETRASNPEATTLPISMLKTTTKKRAIEQHKHLPGTTAGGDQNARDKGQNHGKKIGVLAAFSSDPSTALESHILHENDVINYEEASSHSAATSTQDVFIAASLASDAIVPPPLAIVISSTTANRTNPWSLTPGRIDSISTLLPPSPISVPTRSDSLSSTDADYGDSDNDVSMEDVIDPPRKRHQAQKTTVRCMVMMVRIQPFFLPTTFLAAY
ncbi:hypothetical protein EPUS_05590 [Endocarpon pusillum Z07020]|uniref:Myb-like DNA-binding domain-containing protein n=1 Tax=Endocarpon pusillum (strain Z07020 / HMAS-L-300199) TaxID=1263415 RepID=U1GHY5_ENDPU|nr:uncharacterized protein EPUS_05590 [Endocarpon pusillum Z07020]ERF71718.1 hypothetical protein EPUS_05590 [Endocarpon pusillum Z07020]